MNEAALLAARHGLRRSSACTQLEEAIDRVMAGPERRSRLISDGEKRVIAYHEGGHALVGARAAEHRPGAQGVDHPPGPRARATRSRCRLEDKFLVSRSELHRRARDAARRAHGRGADLRRPDDRRRRTTSNAPPTIARQMVTEFGMSDALGPMRLRAAPGRGVPRPRPRHHARLLRRGRRQHRRRGPARSSSRAHDVARRDPRDEPRRARPSRRGADRARDPRGRPRPWRSSRPVQPMGRHAVPTAPGRAPPRRAARHRRPGRHRTGAGT